MTERAARIRDELLLRYPESRLTRVATTQVQSPLSRSLPSDYPEFLEQVGWGEVGRMQYMFYGGPILPDEIFDPDSVSALVDVFLIGDNFAGDSVGYAFRDNQGILWRLITPSPRNLSSGYGRTSSHSLRTGFCRLKVDRDGMSISFGLARFDVAAQQLRSTQTLGV
jgi:hypothetical protein